LPVQAAPHWAAWGAGQVPPHGIWRSVQAQNPLKQSQRRARQSLFQAQLAPDGWQAVPAMLKGQEPASTVTTEASPPKAASAEPEPEPEPEPESGPGTTTAPPVPVAVIPAPPLPLCEPPPLP
jgi:hypothetical protein